MVDAGNEPRTSGVLDGGGHAERGRAGDYRFEMRWGGRRGVSAGGTGLSGWLVRCVMASVGAIVIVLAFVLFVPLLAVGIAALVIAGGVMLARRWVVRQREPNGMLDGRRNVRVRVRREG